MRDRSNQHEGDFGGGVGTDVGTRPSPVPLTAPTTTFTGRRALETDDAHDRPMPPQVWWAVGLALLLATAFGVLAGHAATSVTWTLTCAGACLVAAVGLAVSGRTTRRALDAPEPAMPESVPDTTLGGVESAWDANTDVRANLLALAAGDHGPLAQFAQRLAHHPESRKTWALVAVRIVDGRHEPAAVEMARDGVTMGPLTVLESCALDSTTLLVAIPSRDVELGAPWLVRHLGAHAGQPGGSSVRAGVAFHPVDDRTVKGLADKARDALGRGHSTVVYYAPASTEAVLFLDTLVHDARRALRDNEVFAHFQPMLEPAAVRVAGVEAFARWLHPTAGLMEARTFLPTVSGGGVGLDVGERVLREACQQVARWRRQDAPNLFVSVNLSCAQLADTRTMDILVASLNQLGLPGEAIRLEASPETLLSSALGDRAMMRYLQRLGVQVWADVASWDPEALQALSEPAVRGVKIAADQLLVPVIHRPRTERVAAWYEAASKRGWTLAVKNVESRDQFEAAVRLPLVSYVQGNAVCKPVPPAGVRQVLQEAMQVQAEARDQYGLSD